MIFPSSSYSGGRCFFMGSASVYLPYSYVILLVQLCCTFGAPMLPLLFSYAVLTVFLCWTNSFPMLDLWYQNALLFWYCQYLPIFHIEVLAKTNKLLTRFYWDF